jgi:hypothetical protein
VIVGEIIMGEKLTKRNIEGGKRGAFCLVYPFGPVAESMIETIPITCGWYVIERVFRK